MEGKHCAISGHAEPGFEGVADAFAENFARRNELGSACSMYVDGTAVVDLWGGVRNRKTGKPWERDTMVIVWSATKGMSGLAVALAASRGLLEYDERVSTYWPEFAQQGKAEITVRQLLAYQAGLFALDAPVDRMMLADLDRLAVVLAQQRPAWAPGERQAYSMLCLGFYEGELLRRVDPLHRSLGQFFQEEIASPLGLDFYIRLPDEIPNPPPQPPLVPTARTLGSRLPILVGEFIIMAGLRPAMGNLSFLPQSCSLIYYATSTSLPVALLLIQEVRGRCFPKLGNPGR